jgi:hypothetical protein
MRYQFSIGWIVLSAEISQHATAQSGEARRGTCRRPECNSVNQPRQKLPGRAHHRGTADLNPEPADQEWEWAVAAARSSSDGWARLLMSRARDRDRLPYQK